MSICGLEIIPKKVESKSLLDEYYPVSSNYCAFSYLHSVHIPAHGEVCRNFKHRVTLTLGILDQLWKAENVCLP
jgi:hypothetical protein